MIGLYGPVLFTSGTGSISTFDELKKTVSARWGVHELFQAKPLLEYVGPQLIELSFKMNFIRPWTIDPTTAMVLLEETMDLAIPYPLVIGIKPMGRGSSLFVMERLEENPKFFYRGGNIMGASVDVTLKEYPDIFLSTLAAALGGIAGGTAPDVQAAGLPSSLLQPEIAAVTSAISQVVPLGFGTNAAGVAPVVAWGSGGNIVP